MQLSEDNIADYADTLVIQVRNGGGPALDYSENSLATLEALLHRSDAQFAASTEDQRNLVVFYYGCYLGEVMARTLNGVWQFEPEWASSSLIFPYGQGGLQVHPFHKVHRRITEGPEENDLVAYYEGLKQRISPTDAA